AYAAAGVALPRVAQAQYDATATNTVPLDQLRPGDLVFFGASTGAITHVGIVVSPGEMVDAPHTVADVRIERSDWPALLAATRPVGAQGCRTRTAHPWCASCGTRRNNSRTRLPRSH